MVSRQYWIAFAFSAVAAAVPLFSTAKLPMVDLPRHAAQVALFAHFGDPCYDFPAHFELNWATPYLLAYLLAGALAKTVGVDLAVKLTVYVAVLLLPLSLLFLLRRVGTDPWLSLLGFPAAFGFSFYWGFLNFFLAAGIGLFYIALGYEQSITPTWRRAAAMAMLSILLLMNHILMLAVCVVIVAAFGAVSRSRRTLLWVTAPALPAALLAGAWVYHMRVTQAAVRRPPTWQPGVYRVPHLSWNLFSNEPDTAAVLLFAVIVAGIVLWRPRLAREPRRWVIAATGAALYFAAPVAAFGTAFLYARFAVVMFVGALFALETSHKPRNMARALIFTAVVLWMAVLAVRFHRFDAEAREFDVLLDAIPANRHVLQFNIQPFSDAVPGPVFFHFSSYYQQQKGGLVAWSSAADFPAFIRYRKGMEPKVRSSSVPQASGIDWNGVAQYDYILLRADRDPSPLLFARAPFTIERLGRSGAWWLYATPRAAQPAPNCPPLAQP